MNRLVFAALAVAALGSVSPVLAQDLTDEQQIEATEFALNNSIFVLYHEIGHLFVEEFQLPVLGKEEDAADILAAVTLLAARTDEASQTLIDAADGWALMENSKAGENYEEADFYDEHSLDIQRSYQVVCMMVGADPEAFGDIATEYQMDADRQDGCTFDYEKAAASWDGLLEPNLRNGGEGGKIKVTYEAPDEEYADIAQLLEDSKFLETAADTVSKTYALPRDLSFTAKQCDEENAFYAYEEGGITFCYEMFTLFFNLVADDMLAPPTT